MAEPRADFWSYDWQGDPRYRRYLASAIHKEYFKDASLQEVRRRLLRLREFYWTRLYVCRCCAMDALRCCHV